MHPGCNDRVRREYRILSRGLIGSQDESMTLARSAGIMNQVLD